MNVVDVLSGTDAPQDLREGFRRVLDQHPQIDHYFANVAERAQRGEDITPSLEKVLCLLRSDVR